MPDVSPAAARLQTLFTALLEKRPFGDPWLADLWQRAADTRPGVASKRPKALGDIVVNEPESEGARPAPVFDRPLAPPAAFLRWLLEHPDEMEVADRETFGAKNEEVRSWRRRLFSDEPVEVTTARSEGLRQLSSRLAQRGRNKWWLFEGFARVDACFVTDHAVLVVEPWREELGASCSRWYPDRVQVWRDLEATRELAIGKAFGLVLVVDDEAQGQAALEAAAASMEASYPHLVFEEQEKLERHLLGYVTWSALEAMRDAQA